MTVQQRLKAALPDDFDLLQADTVETYRSLLRILSASISSAEKDRRESGETLLRLCLAWAVSRRSLDGWTAFEELKSTFFKDDATAARAARKVLTRGKIADISNASAVAGLANEAVREARSQTEREARRQSTLQAQLNVAQAEITELRTELERVSRERDGIAQQLQDAKVQLDQMRQHWGHDVTDIKARHNALLKQRIIPMLSDAIDALEIDPPAPDIALRRLKLALSSIEAENQ
jgi:chromosome segregation ATPase